ncbi:Lar family restriction alleviation protein [Achromobacter dolens]|uniref:Lar family restriction alleviation protein n=1 Tax=Achromobacter dolens TaxID=1287738 RepID=UPI003B98FC54
MTTTMPAVPRTLLSCPFCGGTRIFTEPDERGSGGQWVTPIHVGCNDCKAEQVADTVDEAVERWNRRSAAPGVSTVEAQPVAWMDPDTQDVISAERKASWLNEYGAGGAAKAATYTRALGDLRPAPAAGDARELLGALIDARRELHACQAVIHYAGGFDPAYVRDAQAAIKRADAAIAAQQGQDGR